MTTPQLGANCRYELASDAGAIRIVERLAFDRPNEALLVDALREAGALILSAVAEVGGRVIGHIAFSPVSIEGEGENFEALALAPMAVHPEWQGKGVGSALARWSLEECRRAGHKLVVVLGHAEYYPRFGFVPARPQLRCPFEVPAEAFMALELEPGALAKVRGVVRYRDEFNQV